MKRHTGFTLLEIMLVILMIGLLAGVAAPNFDLGNDEDKIAKPARRFKAVFDLASEYAMLNQLELGLIVKDNNYRFVSFNGQKWEDFQPEKFFAASDNEEGIDLTLEIDGLPWAENNLLAEVSFQDEDFEDDENDDKELLSPQIFILSSGDITPFRMTFTYKPEYDDPLYFQVTGDFSIPLAIKGPLEEPEE
ncbi:MAG: general secretion pathway protein H [Phenylobacterium sp.]|jgi:general secretion pathway protein H